MLALCLFGPALAAAQDGSEAPGRGFVEQAEVQAGERQLVVSGWVAPTQPNVFVTNLIVRIGGSQVYRGRMQRFDRPDVVRSTGRVDWLPSGFRAEIALPRATPSGRQPLKLSVRLGDGTEFDLEPAAGAATVDVPAAPMPSARALAAAAMAVLAPLLVLLCAGPVAKALAARGRAAGTLPALFAAAVALSFALLVAAGWTGSSLALALADPALTRDDGRNWAGQLRPIRSDEWQAITPLAIAQLRHDPPLPIVNHNLGRDGANMLVIGMTGVPVAHLSSLAKPATWGFFVLDLKRALAWYWWFPFYACFAALWLLLVRMFALEWRLAAGLAVAVAAAPYSVVFSGWPAYAAFFPLLAVLLADVVLRTRRSIVALLGGAALGVTLTGAALVLYPAWQISLAWLLGPLALAWFWRDRGRLLFGPAQALALVVAVGLAALLLGMWWLDARDAVALMRGTVYPGQRSAEAGSDIDPWFLAKGLMSPITMYRDSPAMDQSDAGSFVFVLLPALAALLLAWRRARRIDPVAVALAGFVVLALAFMFVGFDPRLARWTLWGSTTSYRMDLALGLAQALLIAWLAAAAHGAAPASPPSRTLALLVATAAGLHAAWLLGKVPPPIGGLLTPAFALLSCVALAAAAFLLLDRRHRAFVALYGAWMLGTSLPFNPVGQAPASIELVPELSGVDLSGADRDGRRGVAVIDQRNWAMTLPAAGVPVVNSVFYHPQPSLWAALDPAGAERVLYNRYQRLLFTVAPLADGPAHRIESPRLDEVRVTFDPARFDFGRLGARFVMAPPNDAAALGANSTLEMVKSSDEFALFQVRAP